VLTSHEIAYQEAGRRNGAIEPPLDGQRFTTDLTGQYLCG
jgi:hypothetical protein